MVRVALLAPFASSNPAIQNEALALHNAAELALFEQGDSTMLLMPIDSGDTPESARTAAIEAIRSGADFVLGPLFASGVGAIAPYSRANNVAMFSFSTDISEAGRTIYVLTFLPEDEARNIVRYAGQRGIKRLIVLAPEGRYGDRVSTAARETASAMGLKILVDQRYDPRSSGLDSAIEASRRVARMIGTGRENAILIPERGPVLRSIVQTLTEAGASSRNVRYLGTGLWNDAEVLSDVRMEGAWFVTPDFGARAGFEARFNEAYQQKPTRLAGIAYDATAMLARMTKGGNKSGASPRAIEAPEGFSGVDGLFRFKAHVVERGMAVNEVVARRSKVVQEAPQSFLP
ncbi:penicillin-binding protein activator [Candidatus Phycosocius spiralis]|uniref:Penicillin-binding protein activator n=1 Tax=Candidatus Phycosocius spiralis TaxID=2815099 RepID=A0ABQ4PTS7_9PROT|nr:penicillin-binding protein activator [Candidatus Phycosocius spiralis]